MPVIYDKESDHLLQESKQCRVYLKTVGKPVYIVEPAKGKPKGVILFIHGICEHAFRYFTTATELAEQGYQVVLFHLIGHGSPSTPDDPFQWLAKAYLETPDPEALTERIKKELENYKDVIEKTHDRHVEEFSEITMEDHAKQIDSIVAALDKVKGKEKIPFFVAGHSLGGMLAAETGWRLCVEGPIKPRGVALFCPVFKSIPPPDANFVESSAVKMSWASKNNALLMPVRWIVKGIANLGVIQDTHWVSDCVSDLEAERELNRTDPLMIRKVPLTYLSKIEDQMIVTMTKSKEYPTDLIGFVARDDRVVHGEGGISFFRNAAETKENGSSILVQIDDFPFHELLRSSKAPDILKRLKKWLIEHLDIQ